MAGRSSWQETIAATQNTKAGPAKKQVTDLFLLPMTNGNYAVFLKRDVATDRSGN
jgi:hypothetical protein